MKPIKIYKKTDKFYKELDDKKEEINYFTIQEYLINYGDDIFSLDKYGCSALFRSLNNSYTNKFTGSGELEIAKILLKTGVNVNLQNTSGQTALFVAAENNDLEMVKTLLSLGADSKIKDTDGNYAIDMTDDLEIRNILS